MAMVVQHKMTAMNSNRMLGVTTGQQAKSTEKLSSGYKINRAADDAAGLAISEKMRKQIKGLTQASDNAQDGISAVQTAEGALGEVHDMLQRMNQLAVKAANGTNSESDRSAIQSEVDQLVTEIDRVSTTTKFNETYLLKGTDSQGKVGNLEYTQATANLASKLNIDSRTGIGKASFTTAAMTKSSITSKITSSMTYGKAAANTKASTISITLKAANGASVTYTYIKSTSAASATSSVTQLSAAKLASELNRVANSASKLNDNNQVTDKYFTSMDSLLAAVRHDNAADMKNVTAAQDGSKLQIKVEAFADLNNATDLSLHVGADSSDDNKITMNIAQMSARGLGINGLDLSGDTPEKATKAIDVIADALQKVSDQRASLGAIQNRLEHTIKNLDNVVENTTSAESAIRDTDMASEMVTFSKNNILAQAGQSMLAQANQSNQGVLSLL